MAYLGFGSEVFGDPDLAESPAANVYAGSDTCGGKLTLHVVGKSAHMSSHRIRRGHACFG